MPIVNNVTRLLKAQGIPYTAYELPAEKLGALETARLLHVDPAIVFKTIVVKHEKPSTKKPLLVLVPGNSSVDLKRLAAALGEKKLFLPSEREAEALASPSRLPLSPSRW